MRRSSDRGSAALEAGLLAAGTAAGVLAAASLTGGDVLAMFQTWFDAVGTSLGG